MRGRRPNLLEHPHLEGLDALAAAERVARPEPAFAAELAERGVDRARLVVDLFEARACSGEARRRAGAYYTPDWVIDAMLERLPLHGELVDPAAGAGAFVLRLVRRLGPSVLDRLRACDIDARALDAACLALEAHLGTEHREALARWRAERTHVLDFLREAYPAAAPDLILGNPPYGLDTASDLPQRFPSLAGEIDLYACFLLRSAEVVRPGGQVALLVPDSWLTNARAAGLRRALAEHGLERLVDFGKPFRSARDTRVHAVVLRRGSVACTVESRRAEQLVPMAGAGRDELAKAAPGGWFLYRTSREREACRRIEAAPRRVGDDFEVLYGIRTGDNKEHVAAAGTGPRLVGGEDLEAYDRSWRPKVLRHPDEFRRQLSRQLGRCTVGIQRIRTNSSQPWRRWLEAAPLAAHEAGLDSLSLVADARSQARLSPALLALLGLLNSSVLNRWYRLTFTDVNVKPTYLVELPSPRVDPDLAALVSLRLNRPGDATLERAIDRLSAQALGLDEEHLATFEEGFWEERLVDHPLPSVDEARLLASAGEPSSRTRSVV